MYLSLLSINVYKQVISHQAYTTAPATCLSRTGHVFFVGRTTFNLRAILAEFLQTKANIHYLSNSGLLAEQSGFVSHVNLSVAFCLLAWSFSCMVYAIWGERLKICGRELNLQLHLSFSFFATNFFTLYDHILFTAQRSQIYYVHHGSTFDRLFWSLKEIVAFPPLRLSGPQVVAQSPFHSVLKTTLLFLYWRI